MADLDEVGGLEGLLGRGTCALAGLVGGSKEDAVRDGSDGNMGTHCEFDPRAVRQM